MDLSSEEWEKQSQTVNAQLKLLQYNWLMRSYMTPVKLKRFNSAIPDVCVKYDKEKGTIFHCLWKCSQRKEVWEEVK